MYSSREIGQGRRTKEETWHIKIRAKEQVTNVRLVYRLLLRCRDWLYSLVLLVA